MTPQSILFIVGIVMVVAAVVLAAVAFLYYRRVDIRAVQDDLSGKARQAGAAARVAQGRERRVGLLGREGLWQGAGTGATPSGIAGLAAGASAGVGRPSGEGGAPRKVTLEKATGTGTGTGTGTSTGTSTGFHVVRTVLEVHAQGVRPEDLS